MIIIITMIVLLLLLLLIIIITILIIIKITKTIISLYQHSLFCKNLAVNFVIFSAPFRKFGKTSDVILRFQ